MTRRIAKNAAAVRTPPEDHQKREKNRILSKSDTLRRLQANEVYRERNSARAKGRLKQADNISRAEARMRIKLLQLNDAYRKQHCEKVSVGINQQLEQSEIYSQNYRERARFNVKKVEPIVQPIIDNALNRQQLQAKQNKPKKKNIGDRTMLHLQFATPKIECVKTIGDCTKIERQMTSRRDHDAATPNTDVLSRVCDAR